MKTHKDTQANQGAAAPRVKRWMIAAALAVAAVAATASVASGAQALHGHHGAMSMNPAHMAAHIDRMVEQCAADASPDQQKRLASIAKALVTDLRPVHEQFRADHAHARALLLAPAVDRTALEQWRAAQMQRMDLMSRRVLSAVEDSTDLLTPEQRAACAGRLGIPNH